MATTISSQIVKCNKNCARYAYTPVGGRSFPGQSQYRAFVVAGSETSLFDTLRVKTRYTNSPANTAWTPFGRDKLVCEYVEYVQ
jgi:hypothetical protein